MALLIYVGYKMTSSGFINLNQRDRYTYEYGQSRRNDFITAMLILIAEVMKADGHVKRSELNFVKRRLEELLGHETASSAILQLRDILKRRYNIFQVTETVNRMVDYDSKLEILHILYGIAAADGDVCNAEIQLIRQIAYGIGITPPDAESVFNTVADAFNTPDDAYKILEITPQASDEEVKKAYRTMAMRYHPDRVADLGPEVQKNAEKRFVKVQEAYDRIKNIRGFK